MSYFPNISAQVNSAGTNYARTTTTARVDFGTTDPEITLPTPGTYIVFAGTLYTADAVGALDVVAIALRNSTDSVYEGLSCNAMGAVASGQESLTISAVVTVTAPKVIQLWAVNATANRGTLIASVTYIHFIRLRY